VVKGQALVGPLNILLVGIDDGRVDGVDERKNEPTRADSIMILHVPASHDRGYLVSLPRDLWVKIPRYDKTGYGGGNAKLNQAYTHGYGDPRGGGPGQAGGLELLMRTIKDVTGITFNAAATVNFTGFTAAVKVLGGVTMYIDERVTSVHYGFYPDGSHCVPALFDNDGVAYPIKACKGRVFEKGLRRLTPEEALDYTRQREWMELNDGDYGRQRHQQQFIKALVHEAKVQGLTTNLPKALNFIKAVGSAVNMWTNNEALEDWFFTLKDVASSNVTMIKTNAGKYNPANISGTSAEALSPQSAEMFRALTSGKIDEFLFANPDWVNKDS
jgi:LCP family protein required for cell wall assembly